MKNNKKAQSGLKQRILTVGLALVICLQTAGSFAQVDDKSLKDGRMPQGVRSSAIDQANAEGQKRLKRPMDFLKADEQDVEKWREMKLGLFIHWGPISVIGEPIGWSRGGQRRGWRGKGHVPVEIYDNLYKQFNPVMFDADEWVQMAQDAGMKYLVCICKHHDGFSMFDSKLTDYKITNSPFKRDIFGELADACHRAGLKIGFYYSLPDWYHPDYRTENHQRYIEFMHGQVRELCTNYGKIDIVWWDGLGGSARDWDSHNLFRMIRRLQPHVIINNRAGLPGDHQTAEQRIGTPRFDRPWEANMTLGTRWAWIPNDKMKSLRQCIQTLVRVVGGDGNYLLDVGPMADGRIEPRQVARLKEMGQWLRNYGNSIYATRGGPFVPGSWGASTRKGNTIYLHVLSWSEDAIILPPIPHRIIESSVLTGGTAHVKQTDEAIEVSVPQVDRRELDTIIVLKLDGPASEIVPLPLPFSSLTAGKSVKASSTLFNPAPPHNDPENAVDDDVFTRWAADAGTQQAWLEVDLGEATTFSRARISEEYDRVQEFELQYKDGNQWKTFARGTRIGPDYSNQFESVTARHVRLNILKATDGPTIWEFQLFAPKGTLRKKAGNADTITKTDVKTPVMSKKAHNIATVSSPAKRSLRQVQNKPNVVLLLADDLGWKDIGCYGGPVKTPTLDGFAVGGVRFTDFHSGAAVCSPSRAALLTGRQHLRAGIYSWINDYEQNSHLLEREVTLAEVLKSHGYETVHLGKWHLGMPTRQKPNKPIPSDHGFDYWFATDNNAQPSHKDPINFVRNGTPLGKMDGYACQIVVDEAISWLDEKRDPDKPFFLNIWLHEPHAPIAAPEAIVSPYGKLKDPAAIYSGTIDHTDRAIARLLKKLEEVDSPEDTLIVYSSDNGSYRADRVGALRGIKGSNFEGGLRVPGIFYWPGTITKGHVEHEPAGLVDLLPTICGLLEIDKPEGVHLDGSDLSPLLIGRAHEFTRHQSLFWLLPASAPAVAIRDGHYSLVGYCDYEFPKDREKMTALMRQIEETLRKNGTLEEEIRGSTLQEQMFEGFKNEEAEKLRGQYVRLNMFQESWIPSIKSGSYGRFELFDLSTDPGQQKDLSSQLPNVLARLKKKLLEINASVMADAQDWHLK